MEERTRAYLRGRFRDHYRRAEITPPPAADSREWGYIPWTEGPGTTMVRHRSLLDLGDLAEFLRRESPQHVYFSAGRYDDPGAPTMDAKGWLASDLIFDLDADHLPRVTLGEDTYAEMLETCKDALYRLLDFLEDDFGFTDLQIVFSGGRGYHVHVRDHGVSSLDRDGRREIVDYVRGIGLDLDSIVEKRPGETGALRETLPTDGGWGGRTHRALLALAAEVRAEDREAALARLAEFDGIGEKRAKKLLGAFENNVDAIESGNLEAGAAKLLVKVIADEVVARENAPIDEPVSTDTNRLIRLPGSLHGGSGLAVRRIDRGELDRFDPLVDAVPETFVGHDITVEVERGGTVELNGRAIDVPKGEAVVPEYVGIFLMARGRAEKGRET